MPQTIYRRVGDTEPIPMQVAATTLTDLAEATSIEAFFRRSGEEDYHVDGVQCDVVEGLTIELDPADALVGGGLAFQEKGIYVGYVGITWTDGNVTFFPGNASDDVRIVVR